MTTPLILLGSGGNVADLLDMVDDLNDAGTPPAGPRRAGHGRYLGAPPYEVLGYLIDRDHLQGPVGRTGSRCWGGSPTRTRLAGAHPHRALHHLDRGRRRGSGGPR